MSLRCLMKHGTNKDFLSHVGRYSFLCSPIAKLHIGPQVKWTVSLVIADGHFNLTRGLVWVCMT